MKPRLRVQVVPIPRADAEKELDAVLDLLADQLADRIIAKARAEVAAELGTSEELIDQEATREVSRVQRAAGLAEIGELP